MNHLGVESKIGRKRRKKVEFDPTLLEGKARFSELPFVVYF